MNYPGILDSSRLYAEPHSQNAPLATEATVVATPAAWAEWSDVLPSGETQGDFAIVAGELFEEFEELSFRQCSQSS